MRNQKKPGLRVFPFLLALLLAFGLLTALSALTLRSALGRDSLLRAEAAVRPRQLERVRQAVEEAAAVYHFSPDSVLPLVTEEALAGCGEEAVDVFLSLLNGTAGDLPYLTLTGLEDAIREDPLFVEQVPAMLRENIARDEASAAIETVLLRAVLPLRLSLFSAAESMMGDALTTARQLWKGLDGALLILLGVCALLTLLLLMLPLTRRMSWPRALVFLEGAVGGAALAELALYLLLPSLGLSDMAAELSPILAGMLRALMAGAPRRVTLICVLISLQSFLVIGLITRGKEAP